MLIRFSIENFLSFGERATFSMIPGKTRMHRHHKISSNNNRDINLLKLSIIYGANASGKSNLVKALEFLKNFILEGSKPEKEINVSKNKLQEKFELKPSRFEIEFKVGGKYYAFGFQADRRKVSEEWLYELTKHSEKPIYSRKTDKKGKSKFEFGKIDLSKKERDFLIFLGNGTRENQLFITECLQRNIQNNIKDVGAIIDTLDWFKKSLVIIFPDAKYGGLLFELKDNEDFGKTLKEYLNVFDVGIDGVELKKYDMYKIQDLPKDIIEDILKDLKSNSKLMLSDPFSNTYLIIKEKNGTISTFRVMTKHKIKGSKKCAYFELSEESDGTLRLIDLIPTLMDLSIKDKVFIIDEIDRSLHPNLSKKFLELFIQKTQNIPSQLIVTTHESSLLDLNNFRKDEFWFVEKDKDGASKFYSLDEFNIRYDKRIRPDYLLGRFGAVPTIKKL